MLMRQQRPNILSYATMLHFQHLHHYCHEIRPTAKLYTHIILYLCKTVSMYTILLKLEYIWIFRFWFFGFIWKIMSCSKSWIEFKFKRILNYANENVCSCTCLCKFKVKIRSISFGFGFFFLFKIWIKSK